MTDVDAIQVAYTKRTEQAQRAHQVWEITRVDNPIDCAAALTDISARGGIISQVLMDDGYEIVWYHWDE
jgi:hypothetical protein